MEEHVVLRFHMESSTLSSLRCEINNKKKEVELQVKPHVHSLEPPFYPLLPSDLVWECAAYLKMSNSLHCIFYCQTPVSSYYLTVDI